MSDDLRAEFLQAAEDVKALSSTPDNAVLLKLYGLFKQATKGDCDATRPGMLDFVGRAKHDAWSGFKGLSPEDAMRQYIATVGELTKA